MDFCTTTKNLWRAYIFNTDISQFIDLIDDNIVVIGTGSHEFYLSKEQLIEGLTLVKQEGQYINFEIIHEEYHQLLFDHSCIVYGRLHARDQEKIVDMDTRFSIVYECINDVWKIVHIHQSMPNLEQEQGEYYPKSLSQKALAAMELANEMSDLAHHDTLTTLLNRHAFFKEVSLLHKNNSTCYFLLIDLDNFKSINDTHGHIVGDDILKAIGQVIKHHIRKDDIAGRIGGDEFALAYANINLENIKCIAERLMHDYHEEIKNTYHIDMTISIGIAQILPTDHIKDAYRKADLALYEAKRMGKNKYSIYK